MLDKSVTFIQKHLNSKFKGNSAQDPVVLAKVEKDFVDLSLEAITVILVGLEPDPISRSADAFRSTVTSSASGPIYPELRLNLLVLFVARFASYENALGHLSKVIGYFQRNPVLTPQNAPEMAPEMQRLVFELYDLPLAQQNDIWNMLKIAANPAVLYRVRMVVFDHEPVTGNTAILEVGKAVVAQ